MAILFHHESGETTTLTKHGNGTISVSGPYSGEYSSGGITPEQAEKEIREEAEKYNDKVKSTSTT